MAKDAAMLAAYMNSGWKHPCPQASFFTFVLQNQILTDKAMCIDLVVPAGTPVHSCVGMFFNADFQASNTSLHMLESGD